MAYKVLDLFSGAGGLSRGFYDAGYDVVLGVEFDEAALKTFKENHGKAEAMKLDLFDHCNIDVIINFLDEKDIKFDVLVVLLVLFQTALQILVQVLASAVDAGAVRHPFAVTCAQGFQCPPPGFVVVKVAPHRSVAVQMPVRPRHIGHRVEDKVVLPAADA